MRRAAVLGAVVVFVLGALFVVRPFMAKQRDIPASVPSPASVLSTATVPVERGAPACFEDAVIEPHSEQARFKLYSPDGPAPALRVSFRGEGYVYDAEVPAGAQDNTTISVPVPAPPTDIPLRVCVRNLGDREVGLFASAADRARSRSLATVGGRETGTSIWFSFYEPGPKALTERVSATVDRMTVFRPGWVGRPLLWALLALLVLGVPAAVVWAYARGLDEDERAAPRDIDVNARRSWWRRLVDGP